MKTKGPQAFFEYYASVFNQSIDEFKSSSIFKALTNQSLPVLGLIKQDNNSLKTLFKSQKISFKPVDWYPFALHFPQEKVLGEILPGFDEHLFYPMNISSLLPILALDLRPTDIVLDACAAPGGKTVQIANFLEHPQRLIANDLSPDRVKRLKSTLSDFGYSEVVTFKQPAEKLAFQFPEVFDKILVDAPCSSEKHVVNSSKHLNEWSFNRIKTLHKRQIKLVNSLLKALKPGGLLVYSTCALNPLENEGVVAQVLKRNSSTVGLVPWSYEKVIGTSGMSGEWELVFDISAVRRVYPTLNNQDPMFVAIFKKI